MVNAPLRQRRLLWMALLASALVSACAYLQHPKFGAIPDKEEMATIMRSPNYADDQFQNRVPTRILAEDESVVSVLLSNLLGRGDRLVPDVPIPASKTDLKALDRNVDTVVWFGHSSYYVQLEGKRILIDPVFSDYAAPVPFANRAFNGTSVYTANDMPEIDYLLVTHDHWDHLDYDSVRALEPRTRHVIVPLGVGAYFERWGYARQKIREADWFSSEKQSPDLTIHVMPARHFSGRLLTGNKTLWAGFALETPKRRIFFSGDSGYGPHFAEIGRTFGGFDLAVLDSGQYDKRWASIHMFPEETARAAEDLGAKALLPGHIGRFSISRHAWDDPFKRIDVASKGRAFRLLTPTIGQPIELDRLPQAFDRWWESLEPAS